MHKNSQFGIDLVYLHKLKVKLRMVWVIFKNILA